jgi:hypothetical protein
MSFTYSTEFINASFTYAAYREEISSELAQPPKDEAAQKMRPYTQKNVGLMNEYDDSYRVSENLKSILNAAPATVWVVITEGWCGDAAFNVPMFAAIEKAVPEKVRLCIFFRDSNPELMDANLTEGGRSIPKLIVLSEDLKELGSWGPRPAALQILMSQWKADGLGLKDIISKAREWYDRDETQSLQEELIKLVESYS